MKKRKPATNKKANNPFEKNYNKLEKELKKNLEKFKKDIIKSKSSYTYDELSKEASQILLLLGEMNYIAKECQKHKSK